MYFDRDGCHRDHLVDQKPIQNLDHGEAVGRSSERWPSDSFPVVPYEVGRERA